jgi:hypothetical protein
MEGEISLELKRSERELLQNLLDIDPAVERKLVNPPLRGNLLCVSLSADELSGLLGALSAEVDATDDANMRRGYEELQEKLEAIQRAGGKDPARG